MAEARRSTRRDEAALFGPVTVARASSSIAEQIRAAILGGRLPRGERLPPERELAEQFGVSRVTVRDALRALEATGLIEVRVGARGGAFVTVPTGSVVGQTISDMMLMQALSADDVVEARLVLELGTVTLACARATDEDLMEMRALAEHSERELEAKTYTDELSWDFHALLAQTAHNAALEGLTSSFRSTLSMHPFRAPEADGDHARTVEEHARIFEAIERRDGAAARREVARHLLRGTGLEERESQLLALWDGQPSRPSRRRSR